MEFMNEETQSLKIVFSNGESIIIPKERIIELSYSETTEIAEGNIEKELKDKLKELYKSFKRKSSEVSLDIYVENIEELMYDHSANEDEALGCESNNNYVSERPYILGRIMLGNGIKDDIAYFVELDENENVLKQVHPLKIEGNEIYENEVNIEVSENKLSINIKSK